MLELFEVDCRKRKVCHHAPKKPQLDFFKTPYFHRDVRNHIIRERRGKIPYFNRFLTFHISQQFLHAFNFASSFLVSSTQFLFAIFFSVFCAILDSY